MNSFKFIHGASTVFVLALLIAFLNLSCFLDKIPPEGIRVRNLEITGEAVSLPDAFPAFVIHPGAKIILAGIYKTDESLTAPEGATYMHTQDSLKAVEENYYKTFNYNGWNIIQSKSRDDEALIMAESPFGKLLTIIMRENAGTDIKVYIKRLGGD